MAGGENPELVIDKEGTWLYNGQPIVNKAIYLFFNQNLEYSPAGRIPGPGRRRSLPGCGGRHPVCGYGRGFG